MDIRGTIERISFQSQQTGYSVLQVKVTNETKEICVVGNFADIREGMEILFSGDWCVHPKYGKQFKTETWMEVLPNTVDGMEKYLASGLIKGIGKKYAKMIVDYFGINTLEILENYPSRLKEIPGIGKKRTSLIFESWQEHHAIRNIMIFLQGNGVSTAYAVKIYKEYGSESIQRVRENPYCLIDDIDGIGFKSADNIAQKMGYNMRDYRRCRAGLTYVLKNMTADGHVYGGIEQLLNETGTLLNVEENLLNDVLYAYEKKGDFVISGDRVYIPMYYYSELGTAERIRFLNNVRTIPVDVDLNKLEMTTGMDYDKVQKHAILLAAKSKIMVLTGGPGTGKTTTVKGIIATMLNNGLEVLLAAPTGRAAKRMNETTGCDARTIHRLLEYSRKDGYKRDETNPLEGDVLIVDECSMIDILLMYNLLKAIPARMRLVLVGDVDQLPSVGAGNVLSDIIASEQVNVVKLTRVFRQAQTSQIIMNAHAINRGNQIVIDNTGNKDFFFIQQKDSSKMADEIVNLVSKRLPSHFNISSDNIQVLSPMKKGPVGIDELNIRLQQKLNPNGIDLKKLDATYRVGDKVMQTKNNYDKEVFNGDIGLVAAVDKENDRIIVNFDDHFVAYESSDIDELMLAYACTIHKSQGSEFPVVIIPVTFAHKIMLQRNLIYTGITRARKLCVLIGDLRALNYAIQNAKIQERNSGLKDRLMVCL